MSLAGVGPRGDEDGESASEEDMKSIADLERESERYLPVVDALIGHLFADELSSA